MFPVFFTKCVEPVQRNKDGLQWIVHRFPIKGGISIMEVLTWEEATHKDRVLTLLLASADGAVSPRLH